MTVEYLQSVPGAEAKRPLVQSIKRGFLGRCPHCGEGKLFKSFVKPVDNCLACGEEFFPSARRRSASLSCGSCRRPHYGWWLYGNRNDYELAGVATSRNLGAADDHSCTHSPTADQGAVIGLQWANRCMVFSGSDDFPGSHEKPG